MPAKIVFAGEKTYKTEEASGLTLDHASKLTRPTPPETTAENVHRTFTVGLNHLVNLSSPL